MLAGLLTLLVALIASGHAILYKRDDRAAVGWVGLIWLVPIVGSLLYLMFGINRIRRKAVLIRSETTHFKTGEHPVRRDENRLVAILRKDAHHLVQLPRLVDTIARRNLLYDNHIEVLCNGDEAYPAMLDAIAHARVSVALSSFIFDNDPIGRKFLTALADASLRGVETRVLIDDVGARYSWPTIVKGLKRSGVNVARFARTFIPWRIAYMNLRNHRKLLIVDGRTGFAGGINIRHGNVLKEHPSSPIQDVHFRVLGPVVQHLMQTFAEDWVFSTGEALTGETWYPELKPAGAIAARGLTDGPDEDFEKISWAIQGAISAAQKHIRIVTPYFLPNGSLIAALNVAAMRGVNVEIVLPARNNQLLVQWATNARLWRILSKGCKVYFSAPPFDHSKLMVVDGTWTMIGSANWDPRSLQLNFEFNIECYSHDFAEIVDQIIQRKIDASENVSKDRLDARSFPVRLRDGIARLFTPYL